MTKILVVDDDKDLRGRLAQILKGAGYDTDEASSGNEAVTRAAAEKFDIILLDMIMPKGSGFEALREIRKVAPRSKVIMISAFATLENAVNAMKQGASDYISKPFKIDELLVTVRRILEEARVEESGECKDLEGLLSALSNPIRTKILRLIASRKTMRLMEIARELSIDDHTKVIFHLRILREADIVGQDGEKSYALTAKGEKTICCLKILDKHLVDH